MEDSQPNVMLVLMHVAPNAPYLQHDGSVPLDKNGSHHLLAGIIDPTQRTTAAPAAIELDGDRREIYNIVLMGFKEISARFNLPGGFIDKPESYTDERQDEVFDAMSTVGQLIYRLFPAKNPVREWLDNFLESNDSPRSRPTQPVTIVTNDLNIPWFWLKSTRRGPFFCEMCSMGLLKLSATNTHRTNHAHGRGGKIYEALLINESIDLPFRDEEFDAISAMLGHPDRRAARGFKVHRATTRHQIMDLCVNFTEDHLLSSFRIIHFSGNYSGETLGMYGLIPILNGSLLVLDGGSIARGPRAWSEIEGLASNLIEKGALGCVVSALPVKHDPIASKVMWETFYRELRLSTSTVGQALVKARLKLHDHFRTIGSRNPMWAAYQLIGSPALQLCGEDEED